MKNNRKSSKIIKVQFSLFETFSKKKTRESCILFVNVGSPTTNAFVR